jgi:hypothetical protein
VQGDGAPSSAGPEWAAGGSAPLRTPAARRSFAGGVARENLLTRVLLLFAALVVAYDALAAALVAATGWPYDVLALGALAIQAAAGRSAGKRGGFLGAILAGGCTALAEATLGFGASWLIGPGRRHLPSAMAFPTAVLIATLVGCALGALGGITALGWDVEERRLTRQGAGAAVRSFRRSLSLDRWLAKKLLVRGLVIWTGLRVLLLLALGAAGAGGVVVSSYDLASRVRLLLLCALIALADLAWRREFTLLANLGVRAGVAVLLYLIPGVLLESVLLAAAR